jgi:MoxR-like ATPase
MAIDFVTFNRVLPLVAAARFPVLMRGRHGIGKSESVYQFAQMINLPVVERRASQMTEGDLLGMPSPEQVEVNGTSAATLRPFAWLIRACTEPVVLFIDEIDRATMEVRQGFFQLCDSRTVGDWRLHPDTVIVAAVNGGEHGSHYQVGEMDPAELDRYTCFDLAPSVEDWISYGSGNGTSSEQVSVAFQTARDSFDSFKANQKVPVDSMIVDFIRHNPNHLEHSDAFEPNKVYPSRRSWKRFSDTCSAASLLDDAKSNRGLIATLATAFVGLEASVAFTDFAVNYERQVTVEDIIERGQFDKIATYGVAEHTAFVDKVKNSNILKNRLTPVQVQNIANWTVRLPSEVAMVLFMAIPNTGNTNGAANLVDIYATTADNGMLVKDYITSII